MLQTFSIVVSGKVQGVYYRQSTKEKARELGLTGYVQNMPDSSVMIIVTGTTLQLETLINWCRTGPPRAQVKEVIATEIPLQTFESFFINR